MGSALPYSLRSRATVVLKSLNPAQFITTKRTISLLALSFKGLIWESLFIAFKPKGVEAFPKSAP